MSDVVVALTREEARIAADAVDLVCDALYPVARASRLEEPDAAAQDRLQSLFHKFADAAGHPTVAETLAKEFR